MYCDVKVKKKSEFRLQISNEKEKKMRGTQKKVILNVEIKGGIIAGM